MKEEKFELKVDVLTPDVIDHEDAFFYDLKVDFKVVYGHFDYGGEKMYKGGKIEDIRYFCVPIQAVLDECMAERLFLYYDLRKGEIEDTNGPDTSFTSKIGEWFEWFFTDGNQQMVQKVVKAATKKEIENTWRRLEAEWKQEVEQMQAQVEIEEERKREEDFNRFAGATSAFNRSQK